jgi:hypothetical protein
MTRLSSPRTHRPRRGVALLEVLIAVNVFAVAGVALLEATVATTHVLEHAHISEANLRRADAFFHAVTLWDVDALDRHLGERREGPWRLIVQRPTQNLYLITLADSMAESPIFRTVVFRATARGEKEMVSE